MNTRKKTNALVSLTLLRHDNESAASMLEMARNGDVDAQYGAGLIYAEGRGVRRDLASAFMWLSLARQMGDQDATLLLHALAPTMTQEDFDRGGKLLEAWWYEG